MKAIDIREYTYDLPPSRIANHPLSVRDQSRLLVYRKGTLQHQHFIDLPNLLPSNAQLFFNDTKVIPARLHFKKETGATIEIFLLTPEQPSVIMAEVMASRDTCTWKCAIGNLKRWKEGTSLSKIVNGTTLIATLADASASRVSFTWNSGVSFAELIENAGETPLPPYIHRDAEPEDRERYQTVYSHIEGAVAAPTAGLHFTENIMDSLSSKGILMDFLTLHVSAGTFMPIKTENAAEHTMHQEQIVINRTNIENILTPDRYHVAVGTTSVRTLESLYWYGAKLLEDPLVEFNVDQYDPYVNRNTVPSTEEALNAVLDYMDRNQLETLVGTTSIYIVPGYSFRVVEALITNFHQPGSTLILLVAAFIGKDWKTVYEEALRNDYRFLSYGDSSLLMP